MPRSSPAVAAALAVPAAVLWFAAIVVLAGDPIDYRSPSTGAAPAGAPVDITEQHVDVATGRPTASAAPSPGASAHPTASHDSAAGDSDGGTVAPGFGEAPATPVPTAASSGVVLGPTLPPGPSAPAPTATPVASVASPTPLPSPSAAATSSPPPATPSPIVTPPPSATPTPEATPAAAAPSDCSDGIDNDGDGLTDILDPGCLLGLLDDEAAIL